MIIALSIENESLGSPKMFHERTDTGSPRTFCSEKFGAQTIPRDTHLSRHSTICLARNSMVNGPKYATTPEAIKTSPNQRCYDLNYN